MNVQLIDDKLLNKLHKKAAANERLRMNFDLRTTPEDKSQRMLNVMEEGTYFPIHRHMNTSETVICIEGSGDWILYEEINGAGVQINDGEMAIDETCFKETVRYRICPREGKCGIQVPPATWHRVVIHEPSTILEAKDGAYKKLY